MDLEEVVKDQDRPLVSVDKDVAPVHKDPAA